MNIRPQKSNRISSAPAIEPVTLAEVKAHLRIMGSEADDEIEAAISEARQEIEDAYGIAFIQQTWTMTMDAWPGGRGPWWDGVRDGPVSFGIGDARYGTLELSRYPLISVDSVTTYDQDNTSTAITVATTFDIDTTTLRGRMSLKSGAVWPAALRANKAIEISYKAGYGTAAASVPAPLQRAIKQMAAFIYENPGDGCDPGDALVKSGARAILRKYADLVV